MAGEDPGGCRAISMDSPVPRRWEAARCLPGSTSSSKRLSSDRPTGKRRPSDGRVPRRRALPDRLRPNRAGAARPGLRPRPGCERTDLSVAPWQWGRSHPPGRDALAQQHSGDSILRPLGLALEHKAVADQTADRFLLLRRHLDRREVAATEQLRQCDRINPVGLAPVTGLAWDE